MAREPEIIVRSIESPCNSFLSLGSRIDRAHVYEKRYFNGALQTEHEEDFSTKGLALDHGSKFTPDHFVTFSPAALTDRSRA